MKSTLILNAKNYFLHSCMPSRKNATNLSEPLAFIQFSSYPPKWAFTNPPCFVQKLLASSSKYRDCKRKGGILVYKSLVVLAEKNQITRDITIRECIFKALCSLPFFTPVTYLRSVWFDRQTLATKVLRYKALYKKVANKIWSKSINKVKDIQFLWFQSLALHSVFE